MFFIITPALICGAFAERMKFSTMCVFSVLWGLLVYCPVAHWVWAGSGWLCEANSAAKFPALDFAGGTVVHISSGISALLVAIMIGPRAGYPKEPMPPHNLTYTCIGAALLWVGWFGFNAGSALGPSTFAVNAFVATHMCAACGVVGWSVCEWIIHGKPSILGACSGAVAGLVLHHARLWILHTSSRHLSGTRCRRCVLHRLRQGEDQIRLRRFTRCIRCFTVLVERSVRF